MRRGPSRSAVIAARLWLVARWSLPRARPERALLGLRHGTNALEEESLNARAGVRLGRVEVPLRIGRQIVDTEELPWTATAVAERRQHLERAAQQDVDLLVDTVGGVDVGLLRIAREGHVPHRARAIGVAIDERFLDERPVLAE